MGSTVVKLQTQPPSPNVAERDRMYLIFLAIHYHKLKESFNKLSRNEQGVYVSELNESFDGLGDAFAADDKQEFEDKIPQANDCGAILEKLVEL